MSEPSSPAPIRRLSATTIEKIAAGEVVERPASVVKELIENAIDAGASQVTVRLRGGGLTSIEVADDGRGIPPGELELAVARHATSKLAPDGAPEEVRSLGFRGEALASIASVSKLRLSSRPPGSELAEGIELRAGGGSSGFAEPRAPGTSVEARDLFFNTPARRKFLKAPAAEQVEVVRTVERMYLARPDVTYRVESEGREVAVLPRARSLLEAASAVLGSGGAFRGFRLEGPIPGGRLEGFLGTPQEAASSSAQLHFSVNGRPVMSRPLAQAVRLGYGDALPRTRFPVGVVHLELELDRLDVNVHPTKREVRFARERELADVLRRRVREALGASSVVAEPPRLKEPPAPGRGPAVPEGIVGTAIAPAELFLSRPARASVPSHGQRRLDTDRSVPPAVSLEATAHRPRLDLLGALDALYWVAASDDGLVLIDQHAASERLLFETLRARTPAARQTLVEPIVLALPSGERAAWEAHRLEVEDAGFSVEPFGTRELLLRSVPAFRGRRARPELLREMLRELADGGRPTQPDAAGDRVTATIACHAALRAGDPVDAETFGGVLRALARLPSPAGSCPHGRPILVRLPRSRLDRWFLRQGA